MIKRNVYLLLFILIALLTLISINFYTIKILSAVRAYINGESEYSKGQKDALLYLYTYIETEDTVYMSYFNESIKVPMADNLARKSLINHDKDEVVSRYFLMGRNHPNDIPGLIWLFKTFRTTYMKTPIRLWTDAEPQINQLYDIGNRVNEQIKNKSLTRDEKRLAVKEISSISAELYQKESTFSKVLGDIARKITGYLELANILCIFIIIGSIALYATIMIRRLTLINRKLEAKNFEIIETNKELDTLVYSVSHDLRSPITSIKGLLNILKEENDLEKLKEYAGIIANTINKQDIFILEIIDFFKNKRSTLSFNEFSLQHLVDDIVNSQKFTPAAQQIDIIKELNLDTVYTDELRVKIIINNLLSNAIKYSDDRKKNKTILIKTERQDNNIVIEIADNGIGIDKKYIDKIYDMFYVTSNNNKGTGLGLYILKRNIEKLKGKVEVQSELNNGTKFTVSIPFANTNGIAHL